MRLSMFQSTPPHGGRPHISDAAPAARAFQSTPPHGGRLWRDLVVDDSVGVSIHAPAWGATQSLHTSTIGYLVSIHAPAWGATPLICLGQSKQGVSIHAPAWGATPIDNTALTAVSFQSTPPHGGRHRSFSRDADDDCFNPRPRMGGDL